MDKDEAQGLARLLSSDDALVRAMADRAQQYRRWRGTILSEAEYQSLCNYLLIEQGLIKDVQDTARQRVFAEALEFLKGFLGFVQSIA